MSAIEQIESPDLKECLTRFNQKLKEINSNLDIFFDTDMCDKLTVKKKVQIELFLCYALNSLFWMHLRTIGKDPNKHSIVTEIMKVREYITKYKEVRYIIYIKKTFQTFLIPLHMYYHSLNQ